MTASTPRGEAPVETLRRAATRLRDLAEVATDGPWAQRWVGQELQVHGPDQEYPYSVAEWTYAVATWEPKAAAQRAECDTADAEFIAAMHPGVGRGVARLLEHAASLAVEEDHEHITGPDLCTPETCTTLAALEVARQILREAGS